MIHDQRSTHVASHRAQGLPGSHFDVGAAGGGCFIEHIANLINYSLWSEVLDDRKFYHAVDSKPLPQPQGFTRRMMPQPNKWVPVGPDSAVTMDSISPYVGAQSPVVHLAGAS